MGRARDPNRDKAFEIYSEHNGNIELIEIAERLGVSAGTVRGWKSKDKWEPKIKGTFQKKNTERSKNPRGAPKGSKNALGHGAPKGNTNALKHGLFAKYLPQEVYEIAQELSEKQPIDILWENITLTYANLLHAQRILYVQDVDDTTSVLIATTAKGGASYEIHTSWDKQGKALAAIARAQTELRGMIKTYDELTRSPLVTEEQRLRIENLKAQLGSGNEDDTVITGFTFDRSEYNGNTEPSETD
ncbi:TPA: phage terminase small subunit [Streptococcus pneumoniae]|nr:MAG TPA: terminase small subunit [Caudoviricetes sp.]DAT94912.1 MAG TPA: terminase small subunit [Caudoviricetes sp.]DAV06391.1 MAG TPA: terminase small subunit [Caudoviricetes sp.]DAX36519.1 MAG TPA: terminase small subunit [Caudoviricetes sp.]